MKHPLQLITLQREDIFDISHTLARALNPACFEDPAAPLVLSVRGTTESGKKIVTDAMREELLSSTALVGFRGVEGRDEFWTGVVNGRSFELDYLDIMWSSFSTAALNYQKHEPSLKDEDKERIFFGLRKLGGMTVIQNRLDPKTSGVDIWLEALYGRMVRGEDALRSPRSGISDAFRIASDPCKRPKFWARYIEITVADERLQNHQPFVRALAAISEASRDIVKDLRAGKTDFPVGVYRPRVLLAGLVP